MFTSENLQDWVTVAGSFTDGKIVLKDDYSVKHLFEIILDQVHDMAMSDNDDDEKLFHEDIKELVAQIKKTQTKSATIASRIVRVSEVLLKVSNDPVKDKMRQDAQKGEPVKIPKDLKDAGFVVTRLPYRSTPNGKPVFNYYSVRNDDVGFDLSLKDAVDRMYRVLANERKAQ